MKTHKLRMITAVLLAVTAAMAAPVFAQTEADFSVELTDDGSGVRIKRYLGNAAAVRIPATIEGMPVREIGGFSKDTWEGSKLTSVTIPAGVTKILNGAFSDCDNLTAVVIPEGVTEIGINAFAGNHDSRKKKGLTSVTLPKSLRKIGSGAFENTGNSRYPTLKTLVLPEGVTEIGANAFKGHALQSITIPNSVTQLGTNAFKGDNLTSVTFGTGLTAIPGAFGIDNKLTRLVFPEGVTQIESYAFQDCKALTSVTFPSTIEYIGSIAFLGCSALTTVIIPDSVERIRFNDNRAFEGCSRLGIAAQAAIKKRGYTGRF